MRLASYERRVTAGLLHRYLRTAMLLGRMPSLLGREVFRTRAIHRPTSALENAVVFVCDVEKCLESLETVDQRLIAFCILEDHSEWEAARVFHTNQTEISRRLGRTLDLLFSTFCRQGMLEPLPEADTAEETISKGKEEEYFARGR